MPSFMSKHRKKNKRGKGGGNTTSSAVPDTQASAPAPAPTTPVRPTSFAERSPFASPTRHTQSLTERAASPGPETKESPLRRLLRRSTSSLGSSWKGLRKRRTSEAGSFIDSPGGTHHQDALTSPTRSRGLPDPFSPISTDRPDPGTQGMGSSGFASPLRPRSQQPETFKHISAPIPQPQRTPDRPPRENNHNRTPSSPSAETTFASASPTVARYVKPGAVADVKPSQVALVEMIASSREVGSARAEGDTAGGKGYLGLSGFGAAGLGWDERKSGERARGATGSLETPTATAPIRASMNTPPDHLGTLGVLGPPIQSVSSSRSSGGDAAVADLVPSRSYVRREGKDETPVLGVGRGGDSAKGEMRSGTDNGLGRGVSMGDIARMERPMAVSTPGEEQESGGFKERREMETTERTSEGNDGVAQELSNLDSPAIGSPAHAIADSQETSPSDGNQPLDDPTVVASEKAPAVETDQEPRYRPPTPPLLFGSSSMSTVDEQAEGDASFKQEPADSAPETIASLHPATSTRSEEVATHNVALAPELEESTPALSSIAGMQSIGDQVRSPTMSLPESVTEAAVVQERELGLPSQGGKEVADDKVGDVVESKTGWEGELLSMTEALESKVKPEEGDKSRLAETDMDNATALKHETEPGTEPLQSSALDSSPTKSASSQGAALAPVLDSPSQRRYDQPRAVTYLSSQTSASTDTSTDPDDGHLHEAGTPTAFYSTNTGFANRGGMWIGTAPVPLDSLAIKSLKGETGPQSGRDAQDKKGKELAFPTDTLRKEGHAIAKQSLASQTLPVSQPPMLPFIPRLFAPKLTLELKWADHLLPSDITLNVAHDSGGASSSMILPRDRSISFYDSVRNLSEYGANFVPRNRLTTWAYGQEKKN